VVKHLKPVRHDAEFMGTARSLFRREAETLERLGVHNQIPRLLAYFEQDNEFYLVQDYIDGNLLSQELRPETPWNETQAVSFLTDVLGILDFIHRFGVIHRDLKPENLIRRRTDGKLVLIDFGAVKCIQSALTSTNLAAMVNPGQIGETMTIGTPGYMAPEQAQGRPRPSSDLFALGTIVIQALSGQHPTQLLQGVDGNLEWTSVRPINPRFRVILNQMVCYHFQDRYQMAAEVLQDLGKYANPPGLWQRVQNFFLGPTPMGPVCRVPGGDDEEVNANVDAPLPQVDPAIAHLPTTVPNKAQTQPSTRRRVFISAFSHPQESALGQELYRALEAAEYIPFMASQSLPLNDQWATKVNQALNVCEEFILLLSPQAAHSEILLEEMRLVKSLQRSHPQGLPRIIPIRVNFPLDQPLNYELRGYLQRLQQYLWRSPDDTEDICQRVFAILKQPMGAVSSPSNDSQPTTPLRVQSTIPPITQRSGPPLPVAEPELPEGQVQVASSFYIERPPIESRCADMVLQPGSLIRIKAPRQMGKTSLMARTLHHAAQQGSCTVALSLQLADASTFKTLDRLLQWLCASVLRRLRLPNQLKDNWDDIFGSKYNCTTYFEEHILPALDQPLVLAFDEVDRVFDSPEIASDFFGLLRAWHEEAKNRDLWKALRLVVVHATEVYIPLNANQSPFNVGLPIELPLFNQEQMIALAAAHRLEWGDTEVQAIQSLIGGHPYLVRLALYHLAQRDLSFTDLIRHASSEAGLFRDHLRGYWWKLQQHPELAAAFTQVLKSDQPVLLAPDALFKLQSLGLISVTGNQAIARCELYRQYFSARLITEGSAQDVARGEFQGEGLGISQPLPQESGVS
jgi:hypothetical protein